VNDDDIIFVQHEPCPECGSADNLARYSDGHGYCFGCEYHEKAEEDGEDTPATEREAKGIRSKSDLIKGTYRALAKRGISEDTCRLWGYQVGQFRGKTVQIANFRIGGKLVVQKLRTKDKDFPILGPKTLRKKLPLYGKWLWKEGGKKVVVTEGEIDAMSVSQLQGNKWPVVSVPNGAGGAVDCVERESAWLETFDQVIFMFDMDEPGQEAAEECAAALSPGKAYIARLPYKDANECLKKHVGDKVIDAVWQARQFRPDGIVGIDDIIEQARKPVEMGLPWPWETLTKATYGRRRGEIYTVGAGVGVGKTELFKEIITHIIDHDGLPVGILFLEEPPHHTAKVLAGKRANRRFHVAGEEWTQEELDKALGELRDKAHLFNHFGAKDFPTIKANIRFMVQGLGIKDIFLDHLTALTANSEDERRALDKIMPALASLTQELDFTLYAISHLTTPHGTPHEEGGRVYEKHFTGSRAIARWSHFMFALERDKQAAHGVTTFRVLKDRYTGDSTGLMFGLGYNRDTGRMFECEIPKDNDDCPFEPDEDSDY